MVFVRKGDAVEKARCAHRLEFQNPVFQPGLNVTVRNGTKWATRLEAGATVALGDTEKTVGEARVVFVATFDIGGKHEALVLLASLLAFEHDPACRTFGGLSEVLDRVYPDGWGPVLTVVGFVPEGV